MLLPADVRDVLPKDHAAFAYLSIVDEFDLSAFHAVYRADGRGRPPYHPAMMVALLLYCAGKGIGSSRGVEAACRDDLGCRMITGARVVDHATIDRFRRTHAAGLRGLLAGSIRLCDQAGLVDLALIAGDGTKIAANAAMSATVGEDKLRARIARLTEQLTHREALWQASITGDDGGQPGLFDADPSVQSAARGGDGHGDGHGDAAAWRRLQQTCRQLAERQQALQHLLAHPSSQYTAWQARLAADTERVTRRQQRLDQLHAQLSAAAAHRAQLEAAGLRIPGPRPVPVEQHPHMRQARAALATATARAERTAAARPSTGKVNLTDPTSRIMPRKNGGYDQLHNVQVTACRSQIILAITRHDNPNDVQALTDLLAATRANLDTAAITTPIGTAVFDAGYASTTNLTTDLPVTTVLIATTSATTEQSIHPAWQTMTTLMADPANHATYQQRAAIIEPVFAQLFNRHGRDLHLHGDHVDTELHLWATSHNLAKLIRHQRRQTRPPG